MRKTTHRFSGARAYTAPCAETVIVRQEANFCGTNLDSIGLPKTQEVEDTEDWDLDV